MSWFALYTEPLREEFAQGWLKAWGYTVFYPHIPQWQGLSTNRSRLVKKPYFPRYLFVDCYHDDHMSALGGIWMVPGVVGAVKGTDRSPMTIPEEALQPLFDKSDHLGAVQVSEAPAPLYALYKGNRVKIAEGNPLWGMVAEIEDVDGRRIVATMSGLFGRVMIAPDMVGEVLTAPQNAEGQAEEGAARAMA